LLLGVANFSDTMLELLSSRIEPSQPWEKTQHVRADMSELLYGRPAGRGS
jgi:hypothetical protein